MAIMMATHCHLTVLSCPVPSRPVLSCPVCPVLSCPVPCVWTVGADDYGCYWDQIDAAGWNRGFFSIILFYSHYYLSFIMIIYTKSFDIYAPPDPCDARGCAPGPHEAGGCAPGPPRSRGLRPRTPAIIKSIFVRLHKHFFEKSIF